MVTLTLIDTGELSADCWQAAADRRDDVEIVEATEANAVVVADFEQAARAVGDGRHVLLSPATATSVAQLDRLAAAAGDTIVMPVAVNRFLPSIQQVHACRESGQLGQPGLLRIHRWLPAQGGNHHLQRLAAELDLANWLFGTLPTEVYAVRRGEEGGYLHVHLGFPAGGMALIDVGATLPEGDGYYSLSLIGGDGSASLDDHHNMHLVYGGGTPTARRAGEGVAGLVKLLGEFTQAIAASRPVDPGLPQARDAVLVAEAAERSIQAGAVLGLSGTGDSYELF